MDECETQGEKGTAHNDTKLNPKYRPKLPNRMEELSFPVVINNSHSKNTPSNNNTIERDKCYTRCFFLS